MKLAFTLLVPIQGSVVKPRLLVELDGEPLGTSVRTTRLTSTAHIPINADLPSKLLPKSIRFHGKRSGYLFFTELGRVYHLRDEPLGFTGVSKLD